MPGLSTIASSSAVALKPHGAWLTRPLDWRWEGVLPKIDLVVVPQERSSPVSQARRGGCRSRGDRSFVACCAGLLLLWRAQSPSRVPRQLSSFLGRRHPRLQRVVRCAQVALSSAAQPQSFLVMVLASIKRFLTKIRDEEQRQGSSKASPNEGEAERVTILAAVINVMLAAVKLVAGMWSGSAALVADAWHSLSDLVSDAVTFWAVRMAQEPPDSEHPYGHGRYEALGALGVSALVMSAGVGIAVDAWQRLLLLANTWELVSFGSIGASSTLAFAACLISILSKEFLFRVTEVVGRRLNSPALLANAKHHRSDALSSVIAALGILGARFGVSTFDPLAALGVAILVLRMGASVGADALAQLTDTTDESVVRVAKHAAMVSGTAGVYGVKARAMGSHWQIELTVVPSQTGISISAGNHLAARVRKAVMTALPSTEACMVCVRCGSEDKLPQPGLPCPDQVDSQVKRALADVEGVQGVSRTVTHYTKQSSIVEVWVDFPAEHRVSECASIAEEARRKILASAPHFAEAHIHLALPGDAAQSKPTGDVMNAHSAAFA
eukprot:TRINITY_DN80472_c0_g1_i1.p1 TRINITY_DN80472_c0_g1~~TRINITY_DN80472_c0_g1_i1.p1  ORF type:complete len:554 (+),score=94.35 TRINITY_DN80472_c0_g1_i1:50-1711(+)